jgi:hypothetical protein
VSASNGNSELICGKENSSKDSEDSLLSLGLVSERPVSSTTGQFFGRKLLKAGRLEASHKRFIPDGGIIRYQRVTA